MPRAGVWRGFVAPVVGPVRHPAGGRRRPLRARPADHLPLARGDERAKRTSLGQALRRMRDRIYMAGELGACGSTMPLGTWRAALRRRRGSSP